MASPRKFLILAKTEVTQFTDPTPTAGSNAILVKNLTIKPLNVATEDRALIRSYYGNSEQIPISEEAQIEFDVECAGSGTPLGTSAAYAPLLGACGFAETLTPTTKAEYNPVSTGQTFVTIYGYRDGILYKMTGCAGNVSFNFAAKKLPFMHFTFTGKYVAVTDAAIASGAVYTGFITPVASIPAKMGTVTIGAYAAKISEFTLDMANDVKHALWMNAETLGIMDRKPKGSLSVELVTVAVKDYWSVVRNVTSQALVFTQGVTAGNIFTLTAPAVQLADVQEYEYEGVLGLKFTAVFSPSSGNDEVKITLT
jgi:hypothetical protein